MGRPGNSPDAATRPWATPRLPGTLGTECVGFPGLPTAPYPPTPTPAPAPASALTVLEVEPVEVHPFDQVAQSFRLKRGQAWVADFPGGQTQVRRGPSAPAQGVQPPLTAHPGNPRTHTGPDSRVGLDVPVVDGLAELLSDLDDLLLPRCRDTGPVTLGPCAVVAPMQPPPRPPLHSGGGP